MTDTSPSLPIPAGDRASFGRPAARLGPFSWVLRGRVIAVTAVLLVALVAVTAYGLTLGDPALSTADILDVLRDGGTRVQHFILIDLLAPRALGGALVGAALGLSGALTQSVSRNPLASPDIMGITWGAAVGAVSVIVLGGSRGGQISGTLGNLGVPVVSLAGGLLAALAVYLVARAPGTRGGGTGGHRLLLAGIGVSTLLANLTYWLLTLADVTDAGRAQQWLTGSLSGMDWPQVVPTGIALALLVPLTLLGAHRLAALGLGDDSARGLGLPVERTRVLLLLAAVALAAVATAAAGPIAFVALATPQIAMRACGVAQPPLIASTVLGALLTVTADLLARVAFGSIELPVGVLTAVLGAPYLMYLLIRSRRKARS